MSFSLESTGDFKNLEKYLKTLSEKDIFARLERFGREGVAALSAATPVESGETANSWNYEITRTRRSWTIAFTNSHMAGTVPVAILLQYGHGTGTGGYVAGRDYINPAIQPVFDRLAAEAWKEVTSA